MQPSQCRTCGQPILWVRRGDDTDRWNRPLDISSGQPGFCLVDGVIHATTMYQAHVCQPRTVQQFDDQRRYTLSDPLPDQPPAAPVVDEIEEEDAPEYDAAQAERDAQADELERRQAHEQLERERAQYLVAREAERAASRAIYDALNVEAIHKLKCRKCGASRSTKCWNLSARNRGKKEHTIKVHPERREDLIAKKGLKK
jgi:hypothetical protein